MGKKKTVRTKTIEVRVNSNEWARLKFLAGIYTKGNVSEWVRQSSIASRKKK